MNIHDIRTQMTNEPLIEAGSIFRASQNGNFAKARGKSIFFGVGLCTATEPAVALPFDILTFFLVAEKLKRMLDLSEVLVLIADSHAETNEFMRTQPIQKTVNFWLTTFNRIIRNLHLHNFAVMVSSHITRTTSFQSIVASLPQMENQYLRLEIADILWLMKHHNVGIKLGWTIGGDRHNGHDERFFDTEIQKFVASQLLFIHCKAGKTFNPKQPQASPYIATDTDSRVILSDRERIDRKINKNRTSNIDTQSKQVIHHIGLIVRLFEQLFVRLPNLPIPQKAQLINDIVTKS